MTTKIIAVYGSARTPNDSEAFADGQALGQQLARAGWTVACGGYGGTMEAVSRGAVEAGGHAIGVTCDLFNPRPANAWLTEEQRVANLHQRLQTITSMADGFIALPGGIGTLCEVALTWSLLQTGQLSPRPFILLGESWRGLVAAIDRHTEIGSSVLELARIADSVEEAMILLQRWSLADMVSASPESVQKEPPLSPGDPSPSPAGPPAR